MNADKPLCIYHGNCADGFGAAWAVRKALGNEVEFHPGVYQDPPPDVTGRNVLMVDFSYKRPVLDEVHRTAKSLLVLDHHKTAADDLAGIRPPFGPGWERHLQNVYQDDCENCPQPYALFDMERSGAGIAWDFFHHDKPRPALINHIEDRDLWRFKLAGTREIQAAVFSYPYDFEIWDKLMDSDPMELFGQGSAIERKHHKDIAELVAVCQRTMEIASYTVPVASLPYTLTSDAGHLMADNWCDGTFFAACYWDTEEGRVFSLRSTEAGMDVSEIAKHFGGGGHKHAAGFRVPRDHDLAKL